jgi:hypothetical protein
MALNSALGRGLLLAIRIPARLNAFGFARHVRSVTVLPTMLSCISAAREHQPCGMLSGEFSPVLPSCLDVAGGLLGSATLLPQTT